MPGYSKIRFLALVFLLTLFIPPAPYAFENALWVDEIYSRLDAEFSKYASPGGVIGIAVKDLKTGETLLCNSNTLFLPASVIKLPVMVEAFHQQAQGTLSMQERLTLQRRNKLPGSGSLQYYKTGTSFTIARLIDLMITDSDNTATHMLITRLGMKNINRYMKKLGLAQTQIREMTLIEKNPALANTTSPDDMLLLLEKMYKQELVSQKASAEMLSILKRQHHKWGIPRFLPPSVVIANKTGSMDYVRNDVGIILDNDHPYIIALFSKQLPSGRNGSILIGSLSRMIYDVRVLNKTKYATTSEQPVIMDEGG